MWSNKKHGKRLFKGAYARYHGGERFFILITDDNKKDSVKVFESAKAAKNAGWFKVPKNTGKAKAK